MSKKIFESDELLKLTHAVKHARSYNGKVHDVIELLELDRADDLLNKIDSLTRAEQQELYVAARKSLKDYKIGDTSYNLSYFSDFLCE